LKVSKWQGSVGTSTGQLPPQTPPAPPQPGAGAQPHCERRMTPTSPGGQEKPLQSNERHGWVVVVVVLVETGQPVGHASQQLETFARHAVPPLGARHTLTSRLMLHFVTPFAVVRQQVTAPSRPQVDRLAHACTADRQSALTSVSSAMVAEHRT